MLTNAYSVNALAVNSNTVNNSGAFATGNFSQLEIDITVSALKSGCTVTFTYQRYDNFGNLYTVWTSNAISATGSVLADIGPGLSTAANPGMQGLLSWSLTGSSPTATITAAVWGK